MIVAPQLSSGWQHNYSTKTRQVCRANEQSMYSLMTIVSSYVGTKIIQAGRLGRANEQSMYYLMSMV
jgi:hypothetical protein